MPSHATILSVSDTHLSANQTNDPKHIIHQMMMETTRATHPEDAILAWILSLPNELDPALAATRLVSHYQAAVETVNSEALKTFNFLKQTADFPRSRLSSRSRRATRKKRKLHS